MGLGLNAMQRKDFRDYQLHKLELQPGQTSLPIDFFPSDLPAKRIDEFKKEFSAAAAGDGNANEETTKARSSTAEIRLLEKVRNATVGICV